MSIRGVISNGVPALALLVLAAGCANSNAGRDQRSESNRPVDSSVNTGARRAQSLTLDQLAAEERSRTQSQRAREDLALPPGIEPTALVQHTASHEYARASLEEVLATLSATTPQPTGSPSPESVPAVAPEELANALKAYAKGRSAALDNRHLQAVIEFQKALAIDPDSPEVLREIARSYDASGNQQRAYEMLERLVAVEPEDPDALYALGIASATRREFQRSAELLSRLLRTFGSSARSTGLTVIVEFTLATCLKELGYDRAYIELARRVVDMPQTLAAASPSSRLGSVYRQRGEILRAVGDAHARLGEYQHAIDAWGVASTLPSTDPSALHPRFVYANLRLGRPYGAQVALLESLRLAVAVGPVSDRDVGLCGYVAQNASPVAHLANEVLKLQQANPDDSGCVRAAAMLLPQDQAVTLLRDFLQRRPDDAQALAQLLRWLMTDDSSAAAQLIVSLVEDQPSRADRFSDVYGQVAPGYSAAIRSISAVTPSSAQATVLTRLYLRAGAHGRAWTTCRDALAMWPDDEQLRLRAVEIAAALQEPALVDQAIEACNDITHVPGLITLSQARRAMRQTAPAIELARRATLSDPEAPHAHVELARAHHAHAVILAEELRDATAAREHAFSAIAAANRAIALQADLDDAYETLSLIYGPGGVLADSQEYRNLLLQLRQNNLQSPLYNRLAAQDALSQRRFDQALERLISAYDGNPADTTALSLAVATWERAGELSAAEAWLREALDRFPGDAALREQLLRVQVQQRNGATAVAELESQIQQDPDDWTARRLLEAAYRLSGRNDAANALAEQRLVDRPEGVRRDLELAALYANVGKPTEAFDRLKHIRENAESATVDILTTAVAIANGIEGDDVLRDALSLDMAMIVIDRSPRSPLQTYGLALRALARQQQRGEAVDERFEQLVQGALANAPGANETSLSGARLWQELAQAMLVENLTEAAARVLRLRLHSQPELEPPAMSALSRIVLVIDAETAYQAGPTDAVAADQVVARTLATLQELVTRQLLQRVFGVEGPIGLPEALYETSVIFTLVGAEAGAELLMRQSLAIRDDDAMMLNNLGYMLLERGIEGEEVERMIDLAGQLQPQESNILDTVGWLRYKQGRLTNGEHAMALDASDPHAGAASLIQRALDTSTDPSPEVFDHLGDAKWRLGDEDGAVEAWKRVILMLDDGQFRQRLVQNVAALQAQQWGIIVMDGDRMYEREYAPVLERAREKIEAASRGDPPPIAQQWGVADGPDAP